MSSLRPCAPPLPGNLPWQVFNNGNDTILLQEPLNTRFVVGGPFKNVTALKMRWSYANPAAAVRKGGKGPWTRSTVQLAKGHLCTARTLIKKKNNNNNNKQASAAQREHIAKGSSIVMITKISI